MVKVVVSGACGRMGKLLLKAVIEEGGMELAGAVESKEHPLLSQDVREIIGSKKCGVVVCSDLQEVEDDWDILVEFSTTSATLLHLPIVVEKGKGLVIGTTGFTGEEKKRIKNLQP